MTSTRDDVNELARRAEEMPYGATKVALLEEAVRLADSLQDIELAFDVRSKLMDAATFSARGDVALVAFSWCLAQHDRFPGRFRTHDLMWAYKWIISACLQFPQIPRGRIEALFADFESRCRALGYSLHAHDMLRRKFFMFAGEQEATRSAHADFRRRRRDSLSNCAACVADEDCYYFSNQHQWSRAVRAAAPVLAGRLTCLSQPHGILARILLPEFRLGRIEEAMAHHRQGYRLVSSGRQYVEDQADHVLFLVLIGELDSAGTHVERHLPDVLETIKLIDRFEFLLACWLWCERLLRAGTRSVRIRLSEVLPPADDRGHRDVRACRDWFLDQAREIADQFDGRNGTPAFRRRIEELPELFLIGRDGGGRE
ncbi:MAG: hypothetical protein ACYC61_21825 [Isosphaeraceae bacterium]